MNKFSNILKIPPMMEMYRVFMNKIALKMKNIDPTIDTPLFSTNSRVEDIKLVDVPKNWGVIPLNAGEYEDKRFDELTPEDKKFKLEVNVLEIFPKPVYNFVSILCLNCSNR